MDKIYKVYWIYDAAEHNDIATEGYVGVTTRSLQSRLNAHKYAKNSGQANTASNTIKHMRAKIAAAEDVQIVEICRTKSEDFASQIEAALRPQPNTGWNRHKGGKKNGVQRPIICLTERCGRIDYVSISAAARDGFNVGGVHAVLTGKSSYHGHSQYGKCYFEYA